MPVGAFGDFPCHELPNDATEIEIKRRIFRDGNSNEYFINRQQCKLSDIRALFFDTGVGKSAYSILEQGKIDQILTKSPVERRSIFEEAAGISRFKAESLEAEKKLEKANENIAQVEGILKDTKRTYETRKTQAEKAIRAKQLKTEQFSLEVDISLGTVRNYLKLKDAFHETDTDGHTEESGVPYCRDGQAFTDKQQHSRRDRELPSKS